MMKFFAASLLIVTSFGAASAQTSPTATKSSFDGAVGFTAIRANEGPGQCGCFFMTGGSGEFAVVNGNHLSFVTNVTGTTANNINGISQSLTLYTFMEGVRYSVHRDHKLTPFGEAFIGASHTGSNYTLYKATTSAAVMAGGGVDLNVGSRISIRPVQVDYLFGSSPNAQNNLQNQLRLTASLVVHFHR